MSPLSYILLILSLGLVSLIYKYHTKIILIYRHREVILKMLLSPKDTISIKNDKVASITFFRSGTKYELLVPYNKEKDLSMTTQRFHIQSSVSIQYNHYPGIPILINPSDIKEGTKITIFDMIDDSHTEYQWKGLPGYP
ncbi:MAG: hypothetical protein Solumvirus1_2 [Solumvirus sp.]|uniref:Uncharacterized protein n=1 Tax=Solumvirus sp. TaxID=2487773 RepID=A0A3G5AG37_9VIRU|nr:MAG: hypothetical protein Solumvirus1_2 [Solumvirus sp.]